MQRTRDDSLQLVVSRLSFDVADVVPYSALPRVELNLPSSTTVREMLVKAYSELTDDPRGAAGYDEPTVIFYRSTDDADVVHRAYSDLSSLFLFGVDAEGRLIVANDEFDNITLADLMRSAQAGYLPGDPMRPIMVPGERGDGGIFFDPSSWVALWEAMQHAADQMHLDWIRGSYGGISAVLFARKQYAKLRDKSAKKLAQQWIADNNVKARGLRAWIEARPTWKSAEVASRLGIDAEEAQALLLALGYEKDSGSHIWRRTGSESAEQLLQVWIDNEWSER
jgi:hypothetical protein